MNVLTHLIPIEIILASLGFTMAGQVLLKQGMVEVGPVLLTRWDIRQVALAILGRPRIYAGFICNGISAMLWTFALSRVELSFAHPFLALNIVLTTVAARVFLREPVSTTRWIAISVAAGGLVLVATT